MVMDAKIYQKELDRLDRSEIAPEAKSKIREFLNHLQSREELSYVRLYFYSDKLRMIALSMGSAFLDPTEKDIENGLMHQRTRADLSDWTIEGYKIAFKKFYTWMGKESVIKWIKRNNRPNYKRKPDYIIAQGEVDMLINACDNARDKAIFSLLYDTGIRLGELLTIRLKDVEFDDYGMKLLVTGKTASRVVRAIGDSVGYVKAWMNVHPDQFNEEAWLFCGIGHDMRGKDTIKQRMDYPAIYAMIRKVKKRAVRMGFPESKRINPHKFRHNRATQLAVKVREPVLENQMGWIPSSRMTRIYVHLSGDEADMAVLEGQGVKVEKKKPESRKARTCLSCKAPNPANSKFCLQCGRPLDYDEARILDERTSKVVETMKTNNLISESDQSLLDALSPDAQKEILAVMLKAFKANGKFEELKRKVNEETE